MIIIFIQDATSLGQS